VLDKLFFGPAPHEHTDPTQRVAGIAALPPDSKVIAQLLASDPSPEVRTAAATRCSDPAALATALKTEMDPQVRAAIADSLGKLLAATADDGIVRTMLSAPECVDAVRARVALHSKDDERRRIAINGIGDEDMLVDVALGAEHASVRLAAAERVHAPEALRRLVKGARDKDRGVARLARERLDAISQRAENAQAADVLLTEAEALVAQPGPILTAAVELDRRWKALVLGDDVERRARWEDIGRRMQQRFDRELREQRVHMQFEQRLNHWLAALKPPSETAELPVLRNELTALRGKNLDVVSHMLERAREEKELFERGLARFTALRNVFTGQTNALFDRIGLESLRSNAARTRKAIEASPFTRGLRQAMGEFFASIRTDFDAAARQSAEIHEMMRAMYARYAQEQGLETFVPPPFSVLKYQKEVDRLERAYNEHFNTLWNMVSKAKFPLMRRFFETVASRAKRVYDVANRDVDAWLRAVMGPLESQVKEHHLQLKRRLDSIKRVHSASDELEERISELEQQKEALAAQVRSLAREIAAIDAVVAAPDGLPLAANG